MKALENHAVEALRALLEQVPVIELKSIELESPGPYRGIDILAHLNVANRPHVLVCEVKSNGQPRHVRMALLQLHNYLARIIHEYRKTEGLRCGKKSLLHELFHIQEAFACETIP